MYPQSIATDLHPSRCNFLNSEQLILSSCLMYSSLSLLGCRLMVFKPDIYSTENKIQICLPFNIDCQLEKWCKFVNYCAFSQVHSFRSLLTVFKRDRISQVILEGEDVVQSPPRDVDHINHRFKNEWGSYWQSNLAQRAPVHNQHSSLRHHLRLYLTLLMDPNGVHLQFTSYSSSVSSVPFFFFFVFSHSTLLFTEST
jgi:hypothetical protein